MPPPPNSSLSVPSPTTDCPNGSFSRWFFEKIHPHESALRAYLSKRFPSLGDHDDLVQETYVRLMRVKEPQRLVHTKAFLFTTARNAAIDLFRRRKSTPLEQLEDHRPTPLLENVPSAAESLDENQRRDELVLALHALPERCREVMLLRYLEGCSSKEIADRLGITPGTVKNHLLKGVRDCVRFFEARGWVEAKQRETSEMP